MDVKRGRLELFTEIASIDGKFEGYVKPLLENLDILDLKQDKHPLEIFWEALVAGVVQIFKIHSKDQLATKVPISGVFEDKPDVDIWGTIGGVLKNAFVKALPAKLDETIDPSVIDKKKKK